MEKRALGLFTFVTVICACFALQDVINGDVVISSVNQAVDLSSHLPKSSSKITYRNNGKTIVEYVHYAVTSSLAKYVSYVDVSTTSSNDEDLKFTVTEVQVAGQQGKLFYRIDLPNPMKPGDEQTLTIEAVFGHSLQPYPKEILQSEKQFVRMYGSAYFYAPYVSETQTTVFSFPSDKVESYTKTPKPAAMEGSDLTYGPYSNVAAYSEAEVVLHYENNRPFLSVTEMTRIIEVSHWGNIAVEESIDIRHSGATLKGPFSRFDYHRSQDGVSSVKSFKTLLPPSAKDVYYRDEIGNISTSNLRETDEFVEVELTPRFPLFGGWKTHYLLGYNVPSYQFLYSQGDQFVLKMRFVDHVCDDQIIDHVTVKIILPEGCNDIQLQTPYQVERLADHLHYTYLDYSGRPVITARKENLVDNHIQDFELRYKFKRMEMLLEPLMVVSAFYLLFLVVIIYVRTDFSITKDEVNESRMRIAGLMESVQGTQDRRSALYQSYEDAINKFKSNKDSGSFSSNRKKIDGDYKSLSDQMKLLQARVKSENPDIAEKVAEVQRLDQQIKEQIALSVQQAEKLVSGKVNKQVYMDMENAASTKKEELGQKIDNILTNI